MAGGLRVAVIGAGYFSQYHVEAWCNMGAVAEVYLCDSDYARACALGDRFGLTEIHTDLLDTLKNLCVFDEFRDGFHAHNVAEAVNGIDHGTVSRIIDRPLDERAVDLQVIDRQVLEVGEGT